MLGAFSCAPQRTPRDPSTIPTGADRRAVFAACDKGMHAAPATVTDLIGDHPLITAALVLTVILFALANRGRNKKAQTDDRRMFTGTQKQEAKRRAGGRCEHSSAGFRCKQPGQHADHIYPWSKGGATEMSNCQSLCARHNLQKSAKVPSPFYIHRLQRRRGRYFPPGVSPRVEWRLGRAH